MEPFQFQFVMSFRGITMHVTKDSLVLPKNVQHRVVPINASNGFKSHDWGPVPAHHCFLEASPEVRDLLVSKGSPFSVNSHGYIPLHGWRMCVDNTEDENVSVDLDCVYSLTDYLNDMKLKPFGDNENKVAPWAAAYVDIDNGAVTAATFITGAVFTTWRVKTKDKPRLRFTRTVGVLTEEFMVTIPSTPPGATLAHGVPGSIVLHNGTSDDTDKRNDFILHFLANKDGVPGISQLNKMIPIDPSAPITASIDLTTSCSNSHYP